MIFPWLSLTSLYIFEEWHAIAKRSKVKITCKHCVLKKMFSAVYTQPIYCRCTRYGVVCLQCTLHGSASTLQFSLGALSQFAQAEHQKISHDFLAKLVWDHCFYYLRETSLTAINTWRYTEFRTFCGHCFDLQSTGVFLHVQKQIECYLI